MRERGSKLGSKRYLRVGALLLFGLGCCARAQAVVTVDNVSSVTGVNPTTLTVSHATAGVDRLMIVGVSLRNDDNEFVTSVTYNGTGLSFVGEISNGDDARVELWSYLAPPVTTANVVVTFNEDVRRDAGIGVITFNGVDQVSPFGGFQSNLGDSDFASASVASAVGELVLGVMAVRQADANPAVVGGTERWAFKTQPGNNETAGAGATYAGATSVSLGWNLTDSREWVVGAISIRPVGALISSCDTFRDEFSATSYANQDGTLNWATDWNEVGDNGAPNNGEIRINSDSVRFEGDGAAATVLGGPYLEREANLNGFTSAQLSFDYRETGNWEPDDDFEVYVSPDGGASWVLLQTFSDDQTDTFQNFSVDISAYMASNTRIAFVEKADAGNERFYVDNVQITACRPALLAFYQMDEAFWNGTPGEVVDSSGSGNDGVAVGSATTVDPGRVCLGGDIPFNNTDAAQDAIDSGLDLDADVGTRGTISLWYKSDTDWTGGGDRMLVDASTTADNKYFFVVLLNSGALRFRFEDSTDADFQLDTTAKAFAAGEWHHIAVTWDLAGDRMEIYLDGVLDSSLTPNTSGSWGALGSIYFGDNRSTYHPSGTANSANGVIDEARIYALVRSGAEIQADMNATHACPAPALDHFRITPATTSASTCLPNAITISAEDSSNNLLTGYTGTVAITTSTNHGNWSVNTAANVTNPNPDTDDNGAVGYTFLLADAGDIILDLDNTHAETLTITVSDPALSVASTSVAITFADNVFVITEDPVQVAGRPQAMNVAMWTNDGSNCFIDTNYDYASVALDASIDRGGVLPGAADPTIGGTPIPDAPASNPVALDFSTTPGQAGFTLATTDVGQYRLTLVDNTSVHAAGPISGVSALLTVRPFGLAVTTIEALPGPVANPGGAGPADPVFTAAGADFSATVAGVLWAAADDTDNDGVLDAGVYADNAVAPSYAWSTLLSVSGAGFTPASGAPGGLNNGSVAQASFSGGSATVTNLQYTEVGSFTLQSSATDYLAEPSADLVGDDIVVGRFIPARFDVTIVDNGAFAEACGVFTYLGQDFGYATAPRVTAIARNALGATTTQYRDAFNKLNGSSLTVDASQDDTTPGSDANPLLVSYTAVAMAFTANPGSADYTFGGDTYRYGPDAPLTTFSKADNSQVGPFTADINPEISQVSDGEVSTTFAPGTSILDPTGNSLRFGRLRMENTHGSEIDPLRMPAFAEYWTGAGFARNLLDTCTAIADADLVSVASPPGLSTPTVVNNPASAGDVDYDYPAPGAGNDGFVDTTTDLNSASHLWLRFDWDVDGVFDDDPMARATFGIYDGSPVQIYIQQIYQ